MSYCSSLRGWYVNLPKEAVEALEFSFQRGQFIILLTEISPSEKSIFLKAYLVHRKEKLVKKKKKKFKIIPT